jgi:hypothetical protein
MDYAVQGFDFCSVECSRWFQIGERFKKLEGLLIEIKYVLRELKEVKDVKENNNDRFSGVGIE